MVIGEAWLGLARLGEARRGEARTLKAYLHGERDMGISADEAARVVADIAGYLRGVERYSVLDVRNMHTGVERIDFYIWQAEQLLWDVERIAFAPVHLWPMHRERVRDAGKLARRAEKQRARGTRAFRRAEDKLRHASTMTDSGRDAERFREMADRIRLKLALRAGDG